MLLPTSSCLEVELVESASSDDMEHDDEGCQNQYTVANEVMVVLCTRYESFKTCLFASKQRCDDRFSNFLSRTSQSPVDRRLLEPDWQGIEPPLAPCIVECNSHYKLLVNC